MQDKLFGYYYCTEVRLLRVCPGFWTQVPAWRTVGLSSRMAIN